MGYSIAFIAPFNNQARLFEEICQEYNKDVTILTAPLEEGAKKAAEMVRAGIDVIISRGGTTVAIKKEVKDIPVVDIKVSGFDIIRTLHKARRKENKNKIALVGFDPFTQGMEGLENILGLDLKVITLGEKCYCNPEIIEKRLREVRDAGYNFVVGNHISFLRARKLGMEALLIRSGREALISALLEAERVALARKQEKKKTKRIKCIIDSAYEGIISTNQEGMIDTFNPGAEKIFNRKEEKVVGKHISKVLPGVNIMKLKNPEKDDKEYIINAGKRKVAVNVTPIEVDEEMVGGVAVCNEVSRIQQMEQRIRKELYLKGHIAENSFDDIIGQSRELKKNIKEARDFAAVDSPLLIYGETGTGKELFAQAVHNASPRREKPFVAFNCAALPENLLESELFGYVKGAFTGAQKEKAGFFEMAHEGTIFLDEIGEISHKIQVRLLRVLEEGKVRKLGDNKITPVDVRIIVATNKDLYRLVEEEKFRDDLFYRINVLNLFLPPLRERSDDIPLLLNFFIEKYCNKFNNTLQNISEEGIEILKNYNWPGNIRQLANIVERLVIRSEGGKISTGLVRDTIQSIQGKSNNRIEPVLPDYDSITTDRTLQEFEIMLIKKVLEEENGNRTAAARRLGINRSTIWRKLNNQ